jgi:choline-sulfatase
MTPRPPNILLVVADQLVAAALPAYGNAVAHAPALTALGAAGTVFDAAYCASPLCAPARAAMLTGRLPSQTGVYDNASELPAGQPTIAHLLRAAGYGTALAGKMHFVGPDQLHGFERRLTTDVYPSDFEWTPDWTLAAGERLAWYHNMASLRQTRVTDAAMQTDYDDEVGFEAARHLRDIARLDENRPFFLTVSFTAPHDPWEVRRAHWDLYEGVDIGGPAVDVLPRDQADPHSIRLRDMYRADEDPLTAEQAATARRGYLAAISELDQRVGELLEVLDHTGLAGDTIVLFTADHGEMLGERGLWYKMSFFDGSARVPLLAAGPGIQTSRIEAPVSHLDLAPTIAALAGVEPAGMEFSGVSLAAALARGEEPPGEAAAEYLAEGVTAPALMLRRGRFKYIRCGTDPEQLFDLDDDPLELRNLASDDAAPAALAELRGAADRRWDATAIERRVRASQRRRRIVQRALATGAYTPWDHRPQRDPSLEYVRGQASAHPRPGQLRPRGGLPG